MAAKKRPQRNSPAGPPRRPAAAPGGRRRPALALRATDRPNEFELVHPACARERAEDLEEVHQMIDGGELDIAIDELRWLLSGCPELLEAHQLLGELALAEGDARLARGHFGFAYDLGRTALPSENWQGTLPFRLPGNRSFLTAAKGLALCLHEIGEPERAREVARQLIAFDPSDPLRAAAWLAQLSGDGCAPPADEET